MHSTMLLPLLLAAASLVSALPVLDPSSQLFDERAGNWRAPIFESLGISRRSQQVNPRIVANVTLAARATKWQPRVIPNPKFKGIASTSSSTSAQASTTVSSSTVAWSAIPTTSSRTVATTTTTTSAAPVPTVKPFVGQATFFYQNGNPGACGVWNDDSTPLVALDYRLYGNLNQQSQYCGRSLTITNTDNGKSVVAIVQVSQIRGRAV